MKNLFAIKGTVMYTKSPTEFSVYKNAYLVCQDGKVAGIFDTLPDNFKNIDVSDFGDRLIIPGMSDIHLHAPQYANRGLGLDMELLPWLETYTFPEEAKYKDLEYAKTAYERFADDLEKTTTTRVCAFATIHLPATDLLMKILSERGIKGYVGKVNMDRNSPDILIESTAKSIEDTERFVVQCNDKYPGISPIITPRFTPSCTDDLMAGLGEIAEKYNLPVQSHLSENPSEIKWVSELCPDTECYGQSYEKYGMFGKDRPTVMAHCVHPTDLEFDMLVNNGVYIAHCPTSNTNLSSGIAPVRKYLYSGAKVGLGTDISGGHDISMLRVISEAIAVSKLRFSIVDKDDKPLSISEAFYLATKGGGELFGKVGSFESGYEFDAVVIDDESLGIENLTAEQRIARVIYLSDSRNIYKKYIGGKSVL